jgi:hypothetical protein
MKRTLGLLTLVCTLLAPVASFAAEHHRYYDREARDWHEWNEAENRAYRHWLMEERHEHQYRAYNRLQAERQREYWHWRHEHPTWR